MGFCGLQDFGDHRFFKKGSYSHVLTHWSVAGGRLHACGPKQKVCVAGMNPAQRKKLMKHFGSLPPEPPPPLMAVPVSVVLLTSDRTVNNPYSVEIPD